MADLHIGRGFTLPVNIVSQATAVLGVRGKGKTSTAVVVVEEALDNNVQVIVIDPTDVWHGLRSSKDGKKAGHPVVILGGEHGDLPLAAESGNAVADFAVENRVPMILSLRHLKKGAAQRFVAEFCEQLYHRKGESEHRRPLLLVLDEASRYVPQRVMNVKDSYLTRSVGAVEDIVRQGRASGFGILMIDQRPATLNKDVLTQVEMLIAHAVTSPQDRKALDEWIQGHDAHDQRDEFVRDLASLERGEAWFWMPAADLFKRVHVRARHTFDSSRTPEIGEEEARPEKFAKVDLAVLGRQLQEAVQTAIENDPKRLRRRIAELEVELADAGESSELQRRLEELEQELAAVPQRLEEAAASAVAALRRDALPHFEGLRHVLTNGWTPPAAPVEPMRSYARVPVDRLPPQRAPRRVTERQRVSPNGNDGLGGPHRKILNALAWLETIGVRQAPVEALAFVAGYRPGGGAFNNPRGALRTRGLIDYPTNGTVVLTDAGRAAADPPEAPRTRSVLHGMVMSKLSGPEQKILQPLLDAYPDAMPIDELATASGYSQGGGAFNNPRGRLRTLGLIDYPQAGYAVATDILFPRGLR